MTWQKILQLLTTDSFAYEIMLAKRKQYDGVSRKKNLEDLLPTSVL